MLDYVTVTQILKYHKLPFFYCNYRRMLLISSNKSTPKLIKKKVLKSFKFNVKKCSKVSNDFGNKIKISRIRFGSPYSLVLPDSFTKYVF